MNTIKSNPAYSTVKVNGLLTITMLFMAFGTTAELVLLEHYEDQWQLIPIILIAVSIITFLLLKWHWSAALIKLFNGLMIICASSGLLGAWFHYQANLEFEMELHPASKGWPLLTDSFSGALPTLAPGSIIVFALIGYLYTTLNIKQQK